jgi:NAD(P)-dependent dehydrogenase (short-subunit alcohol dehydrogenase family)
VPPASALVTGASSGIGRAIAAHLLESGWGVTAVARDPARGGLDGAHAFPGDLRDEEACIGAVASHRERFGTMDLLVNAAGAGFAGSVAGYPTKRWDLQLDLNLRATFLVTREALPLLRERRGRIVNLSSILGLEGAPSMSAYAASKHGVIGFSRSLAAEVEPDGVRVTALCPGYVDTPMTDWIRDRLAGETMITTADVVRAVQFLLDLSPACIVHELVIDGPRPEGIG